MDRRKRLRLIQISLLVLGTILIYFTYSQNIDENKDGLITKKTRDEIKGNSSNEAVDADVFYDISYSGLDLRGNRYILKSKEAINSKQESNIVLMKFVDAIFYFKDGTVLNISSDKGIYNNKTLDIKFEDNIKGLYENTTLLAQKGEYSNSNNFISITNQVSIKDVRGNIKADKIYFDLKKNTLNINSIDDKKVNANININEKKF